MLQIFLVVPEQESPDFEKEDSLPVSEELLPALAARFAPASKAQFPLAYEAPASAALLFLRNFYDHYELSQPQRRVRLRFEEILSRLSSAAPVRFVAAEVSEHRNRKYLKKT